LNPRESERYAIRGPAGTLEVALSVPARHHGIALVCHPNPVQGGTMDNKVVTTLAKVFHGLGYATMRFNYRGVGRSEGVFDNGDGETDDARAALAEARAKASHDRLVLAGFSFGGYVASRVAAVETFERMVLVGPAVGRFPVSAVREDTIVLHGEEDDVVALADVLAWARPQALPVVVFPGTGHFFHGRLPLLARTLAGMWTSRAHATPPGA
jgi:alpha/beta superfamily hydrolase